MAHQTLPWASGKRRTTPSGKRKRRLRLPRVRSRRKGVLAAMWLLTTSLFTILWLTAGSVLWLVAALFGGLATVMLAIATFDPDTAVPSSPQPTPKRRSSRGERRRGDRTPPPSGKQRKRTCSARCRASTKPITDCRCVCGGKTHGARNRDK